MDSRETLRCGEEGQQGGWRVRGIGPPSAGSSRGAPEAGPWAHVSSLFRPNAEQRPGVSVSVLRSHQAPPTSLP